jgi:hypothetical protein
MNCQGSDDPAGKNKKRNSPRGQITDEEAEINWPQTREELLLLKKSF